MDKPATHVTLLTKDTKASHEETASRPLSWGGQVPWNGWPSVRGMTGQVVWNTHTEVTIEIFIKRSARLARPWKQGMRTACHSVGDKANPFFDGNVKGT